MYEVALEIVRFFACGWDGEMIQHRPYTHKVDVYSFGIVLWELLTGGQNARSAETEIMTTVRKAHFRCCMSQPMTTD
ncbi:hypothetical protein MTR67_023518 [Solanum verrucosum]|uniref:Protein kinase domain-containing protein n=1 Tax=Solanum verrucosum TaxID=315347 RepID=A0AAF0QVQ4_SOLVR|nr:hypothetical protein MTR67_023518 [Solanum verrucosum]